MHVSSSPDGWRCCGRSNAADDIMSLTERRRSERAKEGRGARACRTASCPGGRRASAGVPAEGFGEGGVGRPEKVRMAGAKSNTGGVVYCDNFVHIRL